ncbi:MAG: AmmeMemoRadiSam system radical SAM enzyme [Thermofilum sp.]
MAANLRADARWCGQLREALLYERLRGGLVRCNLCERRCTISEGSAGFCGTRVNRGGTLYTLTYGNLSAVESRPIEIKPFFHFWPGSTALTFSTWSCNFRCPWCQNWHLSRTLPGEVEGLSLEPAELVELAVRRGDEGVCVSFNEPTLLFEYSLEVFKLARERGLYATYVSNGYMTLEALRKLREAGLDGLKVDVKGGVEEYRRFNSALAEVVWRNAREAKRIGIHVEVVYLVVTGATDSENLIRETIERHLKELGPETPLHFTRYFPAYKYCEPPTPVEKLERAYELAKKEGVLFPYLGNVPGHPYENTYCPECGELLLKRYSWLLLSSKLSNGKCPRCGREIPVRGPVKLGKRAAWEPLL